ARIRVGEGVRIRIRPLNAPAPDLLELAGRRLLRQAVYEHNRVSLLRGHRYSSCAGVCCVSRVGFPAAGDALSRFVFHSRYASRMLTKKIFLASSAELVEDRRAFELMVGRLNQEWRAREYTFDVILWENFIDTMAKDGLQKEYNRAIASCDIFVMLFFTKV